MTQNTVIKNQIIQNQLFTFTAGLTLAECEKDIEMINKLTDAARGERFNRIKENKLYRETHDTWENYCQSRWQLTPQRVGQLIEFAETCQLIKSETQVSVLPQSETQTRPLNQLPPEQKITAWNMAVESANGQQPTPNQVRTATNITPGPAAQWLEKQKELETTNTRYCPNCNHEKIIKNIEQNNYTQCSKCKHQQFAINWLTKPDPETIKTRYCPSCNHKIEIPKEEFKKHEYEGKLCPNCKKSEIAHSWLTEPKTNTNNRYCPNCNYEQTLTDKSIEYNNEVQCSNCKNHARTKGWLTEPGEPWKYCPTCVSIWRNQNGLQQRNYYKEEQLKTYNCTEETCPICERKKKQQKTKTEKPYYPRPETAINWLTNISPEMTITINELDRALADPTLKYKLINRIYEKITQSYEPDILGELGDLW